MGVKKMSSSVLEKTIYLKNGSTVYHVLNCNKFYKNEVELFNEESVKDNKVYTKPQFKQELKNEIKKILNHKFDNIIFLSGAGTSIGSEGSKDKYGKTMYDLWKPIDRSLKETDNNFSLDELSKFIKYDLERDEDKNVTNNLEEFISKVKRFVPFVDEKDKIKIENTINEIYKVIVCETTYSYDSNDLKHISVLKVLNDMVSQPKKLTIVTTNYDLMFEEASEEMNYTVIDGFTFSPKPKFNPDLFNWNLSREVENINTKEIEYKENVINFLKIHGSTSWFKGEDDNIYRKAPNSNNDETPIMIFPSTEKYAESYEVPYFDLFSIFQKFLLKNNSLLITSGFSFGDLHISSIIQNAIKNNNGLNLLITDHSIDGNKSDGWNIMTELSDNHYPVTFLKSDFSELPYYLGE